MIQIYLGHAMYAFICSTTRSQTVLQISHKHNQLARGRQTHHEHHKRHCACASTAEDYERGLSR